MDFRRPDEPVFSQFAPQAFAYIGHVRELDSTFLPYPGPHLPGPESGLPAIREPIAQFSEIQVQQVFYCRVSLFL
jgi:hypothetical protein